MYCRNTATMLIFTLCLILTATLFSPGTIVSAALHLPKCQQEGVGKTGLLGSPSPNGWAHEAPPQPVKNSGYTAWWRHGIEASVRGHATMWWWPWNTPSKVHQRLRASTTARASTHSTLHIYVLKCILAVCSCCLLVEIRIRKREAEVQWMGLPCNSKTNRECLFSRNNLYRVVTWSWTQCLWHCSALPRTPTNNYPFACAIALCALSQCWRSSTQTISTTTVVD